jgi:hypothetical protein
MATVLSQVAASDYIRALVSGYPADVRDRKLIVMLQGYVDDSGSDENSHPPSRHFVLAGYIMQEPYWEQFSDKWAAELRREPAIKAFKMADAEYGDGYFKGMREEFRRLKVNELSRVIAEFEEYSLALWCHVNWDDYRDIVRGKVHPNIDSPYALLFYQMIRGAWEHQAEVNKHCEVGFQKVDFIFDDQGFTGLRAVQWYAGLVNRLPEPYKSTLGATPIFRDDELFVALQAADMLAWHVHRNLERPDEQRPVLERITSAMYGQRPMDRETLNTFVKLAQRIDPEALERGF